MIRTVYLTPEEVRGAIVQRAEREVTEPEGDLYDEKVEIVQTADGHAALVTFADRNAARPASMPPMPGVLIVEQEPVNPLEIARAKAEFPSEAPRCAVCGRNIGFGCACAD